MKAMVYTKYGPPDVLQLKEVKKPTPEEDEVLVKVHAASVNPADLGFLSGDPLIARLWSGLLEPKNKILGLDVAGQVEAVGRNVEQFQLGNEVFGDISECGWGAFAEYVTVRENALVFKPVGTTFEEAAAVPFAAVTALQGLRDKGRIRPGQKVLINGASGGVGTNVVQIAKSFGAEVTGVCSTRNLDMVRSIGADRVIDYTLEDFTTNGHRYDLIFDTVANRSVSDYMRALSPKGTYVAGAFNPVSLFFGPVISMIGSKKLSTLSHHPDAKDLFFIRGLLETGKIVPVIDRHYPLSEVAEAIRYLEQGHARGKVIITVEQNNK